MALEVEFDTYLLQQVRCHEWKYHPEDEEKAELGRQRQFLERSLASRLPLLVSGATSSHSEALHTLKVCKQFEFILQEKLNKHHFPTVLIIGLAVIVYLTGEC